MLNNRGILIVVSGFSGAGKGTVVKKLMNDYDNYALSISATTRKPRVGEVDGREYFFKTVEEFKEMIANDEFIEYATYVENYYGVKPIIYSGHNFKKKNLSHPKLRDYPFWIAHYYKDELDYDGDWLFWQHTDLGDIKGIKGDVDLNIFNGSLSDLKALTIDSLAH